MINGTQFLALSLALDGLIYDKRVNVGEALYQAGFNEKSLASDSIDYALKIYAGFAAEAKEILGPDSSDEELTMLAMRQFAALDNPIAFAVALDNTVEVFAQLLSGVLREIIRRHEAERKGAEVLS